MKEKHMEISIKRVYIEAAAAKSEASESIAAAAGGWRVSRLSAEEKEKQAA